MANSQVYLTKEEYQEFLARKARMTAPIRTPVPEAPPAVATLGNSTLGDIFRMTAAE